MAWLRRGRDPIQLTTSDHLDSIIKPDTYICRSSSIASKALGYPYDGVPGTLIVMPWNPAIPRVIAVFYTWNGGIVKRASSSTGWGNWLDALGNRID